MGETRLVVHYCVLKGYIYAPLIVHCAELCKPLINGEKNWEPV